MPVEWTCCLRLVPMHRGSMMMPVQSEPTSGQRDHPDGPQFHIASWRRLCPRRFARRVISVPDITHQRPAVCDIVIYKLQQISERTKFRTMVRAIYRIWGRAMQLLRRIPDCRWVRVLVAGADRNHITVGSIVSDTVSTV